MPKQSLYEISAELRALEEAILEADGDITDEQTEQIIDAWFAEIGDRRDEKFDGYGALIRNLESRAKARKEEAARINALARPDENLAKRLKTRLKFFMENVFQVEKVETLKFRFAVQKNGGAVPVIVEDYYVENSVELPEEFRRVAFEPDLPKIREALEQGRELDFARLGERGTSLRIK